MIDRPPRRRLEKAPDPISDSKKQGLDAVGVDGPFSARPGEHGEVTILRRDQRDGVALIVDELRRRQMTGSAKIRRGHRRRNRALDRLGEN